MNSNTLELNQVKRKTMRKSFSARNINIKDLQNYESANSNSDLDFKELEKELKESIQQSVSKMNVIELNDIDIPKFREYLDEATIENLIS